MEILSEELRHRGFVVGMVSCMFRDFLIGGIWSWLV